MLSKSWQKKSQVSGKENGPLTVCDSLEFWQGHREFPFWKLKTPTVKKKIPFSKTILDCATPTQKALKPET